MTFRYRGFCLLASNPAERPVHIIVHDPLRPAQELATFTDGGSFDAAVVAATAYLDGLCAAEARLVAGEMEIES